MKTWHAVAFLIVTARGRAGEPVGESFSGLRMRPETAAGIDQWLSTSVINRAMWLAHVDPEDDRLPRAGAWHGGPGDLGGMIAGGRA